MTIHIEGIQPGQMCRVVFRPPSGRGRNMEMTARYLGTDKDGSELAFSQRPKAGTTQVTTRDVLALYATDSSTVVLPHRISEERRLR